MIIRTCTGVCWCGRTETEHTLLTPFGVAFMVYFNSDNTEIINTDVHYGKKCIGHIYNNFAHNSKIVYNNGHQWMTKVPSDAPIEIIKKYDIIKKNKNNKEQEQVIVPIRSSLWQQYEPPNDVDDECYIDNMTAICDVMTIK